MSDWREHYLSLFAQAKTKEEFLVLLESVVRSFEFDRYSLGIRFPLPISSPKFHLSSNYSPAWESRYIDNNYFTIDPTVKHGLTEHRPLCWSADAFTEHLHFWEDAKHYQLVHGWCTPSRAKHDTIGMLSLVRSASPITSLEFNEKEARLVWIAHLAHSTMLDFIAPSYIPEVGASLTAREVETLKWSATGKTYSETGQILSIDERTVKFHLVNAMRKLHSSNKVEAAMKAYALGMLH
ncbi:MULTISPECIES: autoinducer binding domain-containing protein [Pseudomonas]|uniref:DNA-binding protein with HTH domain n=1 Tax=Pseudomonas asplenii TaxID=53407 RepID=A0A0M9GCJ6_9PSED|nr:MULTISPECIES: autoinducer binding domain-containing protein [Pseudomonas]KPA87610.1 DNA-binding protein with HTH domain [Pseudomonas fuscovaginae]KPA96432.1 DNA-binding protein with HTH domain [Pseudomonas fuscovaginae]